MLTQYSLELMTHFEIVLITFGILLIFAEVFTAVGGGFIALLGWGLFFSWGFSGFCRQVLCMICRHQKVGSISFGMRFLIPCYRWWYRDALG